MLACERKKWLRERCRRIFRPNYADLQLKQVWRAQKPNQRPLCSPWILKGTSIGNLNKPTGPGNNSCTKRLRLCRPCSPITDMGQKVGPDLVNYTVPALAFHLCLKFSQPRVHFLAQPCTTACTALLVLPCHFQVGGFCLNLSHRPGCGAVSSQSHFDVSSQAGVAAL